MNEPCYIYLQISISHLLSSARSSGDPDHWATCQHNIVRYLTKVLGLDYTPEEVNHVIGLIEVNAYEVEVKAERGVGVGRGVFPLLAKLNHSCVSNARWGSLCIYN